MVVLIDDERSFISPIDALVIRNSADALVWLDTTNPETHIDQLWLDHDLGLVNGQKDSIIPFVRKLEELCVWDEAPQITEVVVHTSNSIGGDEIVASLKNHYKVQRVFAGDYLIVR